MDLFCIFVSDNEYNATMIPNKGEFAQHRYSLSTLESESGQFLIDADGFLVSFEPAEGNQPFSEDIKICSNYHFETSTSIRSFVVPEGVKGVYLHSCRVVDRVELPEGLISIRGFDNCILPKVKLPNSLREIGDFAFGHSYIEELYIPEALKAPYGRQFKESYIETLYLPKAWEDKAKLTDYGSLDVHAVPELGNPSYLSWYSTKIGNLRFY